MKNWEDPSLVKVYERFLQAADQVVAYNKEHKLKPKSLNGLSLEVNPAFRGFFTQLKNKEISLPLKALVKFMESYEVDANYFFKEDTPFVYPIKEEKKPALEGMEYLGDQLVEKIMDYVEAQEIKDIEIQKALLASVMTIVKKEEETKAFSWESFLAMNHQAVVQQKEVKALQGELIALQKELQEVQKAHIKALQAQLE